MYIASAILAWLTGAGLIYTYHGIDGIGVTVVISAVALMFGLAAYADFTGRL